MEKQSPQAEEIALRCIRSLTSRTFCLRRCCTYRPHCSASHHETRCTAELNSTNCCSFRSERSTLPPHGVSVRVSSSSVMWLKQRFRLSHANAPSGGGAAFSPRPLFLRKRTNSPTSETIRNVPLRTDVVNATSPKTSNTAIATYENARWEYTNMADHPDQTGRRAVFLVTAAIATTPPARAMLV